MLHRPTLVFDVNGTLSDLSPLSGAFEAEKAPPEMSETFFAATLRDGFALSVNGATAPFKEVARGVLVSLLAGLERPPADLEAAVDRILDHFGSLGLHEDVAPAVEKLADTGHRLITLSNGSASTGASLLEGAGLLPHFEQVLSVDDAGAWKPHRRAYEYAASSCAAEPSRLLLVAVHPWDIDGASRAGLETAWINRAGSPYPPFFTSPTLEAASLEALALELAAR